MTRQMLTVQKGGSGLGLGLEGSGKTLRFSHGGRDEGFDAFMMAYAESGQGVVIMINANDNSGVMPLRLNVMTLPLTWTSRLTSSPSQDGLTEFVDDLSITFHVVSYLDGKVPDMDKVVATTLAIKDQDFPSGWLLNGKHWDHLNMDVAELFRLGWPRASDAQKKTICRFSRATLVEGIKSGK